MLQLPNNCRAGKISVYPANWKTVRANTALTWYIKYRFYDDNLNKVKQVVIKGMNGLDSLSEKRDATQTLIDDEKDLLLNQGYNYITSTFHVAQDPDEISDETPFYQALEYASKKVKIERHTMEDLKSNLKYIKMAADSLKYSELPLSKIKKKHLAVLLDKIGEIKVKQDIVVSRKKGTTKKGIWSANNYNKYRSNLGILYRVLKKLDAVDSNLPLAIEKEKTTIRIRETLSKEKRSEIINCIYNKDYEFWRFLQIFFHSGSRTTEVLAVKENEVDVLGQRFKVLVKKGKQYREEWRTIKTVVLPLWKELLQLTKPGQVLFSVGLIPGNRVIRREHITKRWFIQVKKPFGITADFYSLKHSNIDETAELLSIQEASKMAGHTSTVITMKHYAQGEKERQHNRLKDVNNSF